MAGCRGCRTFPRAWYTEHDSQSCPWATGTCPPFPPFLPPLELCYGKTTIILRTCKGCDTGLYFQLTLLSLVWAQAWGSQGFREKIGAERLHLEGEVVCMNPARVVSFHGWKTLKIPFWWPQVKHFPAQSFNFSFWEKELILSLWEQQLNNFWKPLFPAVLPGISNDRGLFK